VAVRRPLVSRAPGVHGSLLGAGKVASRRHGDTAARRQQHVARGAAVRLVSSLVLSGCPGRVCMSSSSCTVVCRVRCVVGGVQRETAAGVCGRQRA
jgi:hypothetical protein